MSSIKRYFSIFLLLAFSGNPLFVDMTYSKGLLVFFTIIFFCFIYFSYRFSIKMNHFRRLLFVSLLFFVISVFQFFYFNFLSWIGLFGFICKLFLAYSILYFYLCRYESFEIVYLKLMAFLSLISFPFFIINIFSHFGIQLENPLLKSSLFYTSYDFNDNIRNSGMFWEPGAFAGYLVLAILFIFIVNGRFHIGVFKKEFSILLIGLISTFSTTGYLALAVLGTVYILTNYSYGKIFIIPIFSLIIIYYFNNLSFLENKISVQYENALNLERDEVSNTRFGSLVMDLPYISSSPFFGNGMHFSTRYRFHSWINEDIGHGNGMSNFIVFWGVPIFLYWLFLVFIFFNDRLSSSFLSGVCALIVLLLLQGEQFLNYPLFLIFFFLPRKVFKRL